MTSAFILRTYCKKYAVELHAVELPAKIHYKWPYNKKDRKKLGEANYSFSFDLSTY